MTLKQVQDGIVNSQVWKSIFRVGIPNTNRKRVLAVLGSLILHLHPVKVRRSGVRMSYTWCMGGTSFFLFPNVLFEPVQKFKAGLPNDYSVGEVDERWKDKYGIWIVRNEEQMYALITTCTHLGCTPNWLPSQNKFKCPCHGSGYYRTGVNFEGPAPRPLERAKIFIDPADGQIVVDKSVQFHQERGDWVNPESFLKV